MSEWKELDIKDVPSDFFVNDNYECKSYCDEMGWTPCFSDFKNAIAMVELVHDRKARYRYRLQPLKSIRISQNIVDFILMAWKTDEITKDFKMRWDEGIIYSIDNREVEVIK